MRKVPIDRNAPPKPLTSFHLYMKHRRASSPGLAAKPFAERNRIIGAEWAILAAEQKQSFLTQAAEERERYNTAFAEYKKTDAYKQWLLSKSQIENKKANASKAPVNALVSQIDELEKQFGHYKVRIFTPEFLEYNRQREVTLRQLRKQATQLEEQTALLSKHVDTLTSAETRLTNQVELLNRISSEEEALLNCLCTELCATFSEIVLPSGQVGSASGLCNSTSKGSEHISPASVLPFLTRLHGLIEQASAANNHHHPHILLAEKAKNALKKAISTKTLTLVSL